MTMTSALYKAARMSATARAIRNGRAPERLANILIGRAIGRLSSRLWR